MGSKRPPPPAVIRNPAPPTEQDSELAADQLMRRNALKVGRSGTRLATGPQATMVASAGNRLLGK